LFHHNVAEVRSGSNSRWAEKKGIESYMHPPMPHSDTWSHTATITAFGGGETAGGKMSVG
jgi:hypothetical protein